MTTAAADPPILPIIMTPAKNPEHFKQVFGPIADAPWVPWMKVWNPTARKGEGAWEKIPFDGTRGLSTKNPAHCMTLEKAGELAQANGLSGIGIVFTQVTERDGWRLVGFDFDKINADFKLPFATYSELSPSGHGVRSFAWIPAASAAQYRDTTDAQFVGCHHAEIYLSSSPRFLTVTFNAINNCAIARLR